MEAVEAVPNFCFARFTRFFAGAAFSGAVFLAGTFFATALFAAAFLAGAFLAAAFFFGFSSAFSSSLALTTTFFLETFGFSSSFTASFAASAAN